MTTRPDPTNADAWLQAALASHPFHRWYGKSPTTPCGLCALIMAAGYRIITDEEGTVQWRK